MRDRDMMMSILREIGAKPDGMLMVSRTLGQSEKERHRIHQIELLADAGYVTWVSDGAVRITSAGYDLIIEDDPEA